MSTDDRAAIAKLEAALAEAQATNAKHQAEIEALRSRIWDRRQTIPGRLNDSIIQKTIRQARKTGKRHQLSDGGGLQLNVEPNPYRGLIVAWCFRWTNTVSKGNYKPRSIGLGSLNQTPLAIARKEALQCREWLREGKDPKIERELAKHKQPDLFRTIAQVAQEYLDLKIKPKSQRYLEQTTQRFKDYVLERIGAMPIQSVTRQTIKDCLLENDLWSQKHVTANEIRLHLERMFDLAIFNKYYIGDNPASWSGGLEYMLPAPSDVHTVTHQPSLNFRKLPEFVQRLRAFRYGREWTLTGTGRPIVSYAIEFLLLFGGRLNELLGAQWKEFDTVEAMTWTIPAKRTKSGIARTVPITRTMLAILGEMQKLRYDHSPDALVFPSARLGKDQTRATEPLGTQTLTRILREHFKVDFVNHGWRSTLKDWCLARARKHCPEFTIEWWRMQVDHWEGVTQADKAYGPDRLLEERHIMMQAYDDFATTPPSEPKADNVVTLNKRRTT
jgi:integrase